LGRTARVALILDTGPLYASLDRSDADHPACRQLIEETKAGLKSLTSFLAVFGSNPYV
jgi:hypothetical protein